MESSGAVSTSNAGTGKALPLVHVLHGFFLMYGYSKFVLIGHNIPSDHLPNCILLNRTLLHYQFGISFVSVSTVGL